MTCSAFALNGCLAELWGGALGMIPWWAPWVLWGLLALVALWALTKVKELAGTAGVVGVLLAITAVWENIRGRQGKGVLPVKLDFGTHEQLPPNHPDAAPSPVVPRRRDRTVFDRLNGK